MPYNKRRTAVAPKVAAATIAGAVSAIVVWGAGVAGLEVPPEVASAFTTVLAGLAGYIKAGEA